MSDWCCRHIYTLPQDAAVDEGTEVGRVVELDAKQSTTFAIGREMENVLGEVWERITLMQVAHKIVGCLVGGVAIVKILGESLTQLRVVGDGVLHVVVLLLVFKLDVQRYI